MASLKDKLKVRGLKSQIEKEAAEGGSRKDDKRFLNYYDMKVDEKMTILFVPDAQGRLYTKFKKHGPKLKTKGVEGIICGKMYGADCPACDHAWEFHNEMGNGNSKAQNEALKAKWSKWMPKDYTLAQVIVIDSGIEINQTEDGNEVKLFWLPYAIEQMIKNHISEDILSEDEITMTPFHLKKTENPGGQAEYKNSFFDRKSVSDDVLEAFEEAVVEPYDFDTLDVVPTPVEEDEIQAWLEDAIEKVTKAERKASKKSSTNDEDEEEADEEEEERPVRKSVASRRSRVVEEEEEEDRDVTRDIPEKTKEKEEAPKKTTSSSLRDRLSKLK